MSGYLFTLEPQKFDTLFPSGNLHAGGVVVSYESAGVVVVLVLVALELVRSSPSAAASTGSSFVPPTPVPGVTAGILTSGAPSLGVNDWCSP